MSTVYEYLVPEALRPALDAWLASRGLEAVVTPPSFFEDAGGPPADPGALPVVLIRPTEETMERARLYQAKNEISDRWEQR